MTLPTILHADWSNRPRTAFRRWTQAVHKVAAIQVGRHRFLACPYRFLAAKRQAKADLSSGRSHDRTAFVSFALYISEQPDPKSYRTLRHTQPWQPTSFSKIPTHTGRGCHTHAPEQSLFETTHKNGQNGKLTGALRSQEDLEESGKAGGVSETK